MKDVVTLRNSEIRRGIVQLGGKKINKPGVGQVEDLQRTAQSGHDRLGGEDMDLFRRAHAMQSSGAGASVDGHMANWDVAIETSTIFCQMTTALLLLMMAKARCRMMTITTQRPPQFPASLTKV